jgi:hypothetical protein
MQLFSNGLNACLDLFVTRERDEFRTHQPGMISNVLHSRNTITHVLDAGYLASLPVYTMAKPPSKEVPWSVLGFIQ